MKRWLATKGYGVHSPLAFRLVRHVIRPPRDVIYYGEETLLYGPEASKGLDTLTLRRARILLRFAAELQPAYVWTSPGIPDIFTEALRLAGCVVRIYDGAVFPDEIYEADMIVTAGRRIPKKALRRLLRPGRAVATFGLKPENLQAIADSMSGGVVLEGRESLLAVNTRDEFLHYYKIRRF